MKVVYTVVTRSSVFRGLESALKMQEMPFQRPKFQNGISNLYILLKMQDMPFQRPKFQKIVSSLWPPPH